VQAAGSHREDGGGKGDDEEDRPPAPGDRTHTDEDCSDAADRVGEAVDREHPRVGDRAVEVAQQAGVQRLGGDVGDAGADPGRDEEGERRRSAGEHGHGRPEQAGPPDERRAIAPVGEVPDRQRTDERDDGGDRPDHDDPAVAQAERVADVRRQHAEGDAVELVDQVQGEEQQQRRGRRAARGGAQPLSDAHRAHRLARGARVRATRPQASMVPPSGPDRGRRPRIGGNDLLVSLSVVSRRSQQI
jgi:hypothetical protein